MRGVLRNSNNAFEAINLIISMQKINLSIIEEHKLPTLLVSYEKAVRHPRQFVKEISSFANLSSRELEDKAVNFISIDGGYQEVS